MSSVDVFADIAREFCDWCESGKTTETMDLEVVSLLCRLYAAALTLPDTNCDNTDESSNISPASLGQAKQRLSTYNGRYYREFFDPDPLLSDEGCMGDIGDDLLDAYKDIRVGLALLEQGHTASAVWHWRFMHRIHWGHHAVGAISALHNLVISKEV